MSIGKEVEALILDLGEFSEEPEALTRPAYSKAYERAAEYLVDQFKGAGLCVSCDYAGNIFGRLEGTDPQLAPIVIGSHLDTVRDAGKYDGIAGICCGLHALLHLNKSGKKLKHPVELAAFIGEEGTRFGQVLLGSRYTCGELTPQQMSAFHDERGIYFPEIISHYQNGNLPLHGMLCDDKPACFIELHDEQGPILENSNVQVGLVESIVGIFRLNVEVSGESGHCGTVPMSLRHDAGIAAFDFLVSAVDFAAARYGDKVTLTAGQLTLLPGSINSIPGQCSFTIDLRSAEIEKLVDIKAKLLDLADSVSKRRKVIISVTESMEKPPVKMDGTLNSLLERCSESLGLSAVRLNSGAGHDAMVMAGITDAAMIFLPCFKGISHNPLEYISADALENGVLLLAETIVHFDNME
ncbi:MAG: M20 family metallo-hydrolase [Oscillospiraceae bacterium]